jgi:hypothetical protein
MLIINDIVHEDDGRVIAIREFPVKMMVVRGKCLVRVGTLYEVFTVENLPDCDLEMILPRDVILIMFFTYVIDDAAWDEMYHPSPKGLASLCSIVIEENEIPVPVECRSIVDQYPAEKDDFSYCFWHHGTEYVFPNFSINTSTDDETTEDDD